MNSIRTIIYETIKSIISCDNLEQEHIIQALDWINSGAQLFRISKPDNPPMHLVSYCVLFDKKYKKILLVDHKNAQLWLSPGGHVDPEEDPKETARRELLEELNIPANFLYDNPLFITITKTVGLTAGHTDVSLWYMFSGDSSQKLAFDQEEFNTIAWFDFDQIPYEKSDQHMKRFVAKLQRRLYEI